MGSKLLVVLLCMFGVSCNGQSRFDECNVALDIVELLDTTSSQFDGSIDYLRPTMNVFDMVANMKDSRFGLGIFTDFPRPPLGYDKPNWKDFCLKIRGKLGASRYELEEAVEKFAPAGGLDFPEGSLDALMRAALTGQLNWRKGNVSPTTGYPLYRAIIVVTDAIPHQPNDAMNAIKAWNAQNPTTPYPLPVPNNFGNDSSPLSADSNANCGLTEYPSLKQIGDVLKREKIYPVFMVSPAHFKCSSGMCLFPEMIRLAQSTGNNVYLDPVEGMVFHYNQIVKNMGIQGHVEPLEDAFGNFDDVFNRTMEDIKATICNPTTTTTTVRMNSTTSRVTSSASSTSSSTHATSSTEPDECACAGCCRKNVDIEVSIDTGNN